VSSVGSGAANTANLLVNGLASSAGPFHLRGWSALPTFHEPLPMIGYCAHTAAAAPVGMPALKRAVAEQERLHAPIAGNFSVTRLDAYCILYAPIKRKRAWACL